MADDTVPVDYDPFTSIPVDYDPWSASNPMLALQDYQSQLATKRALASGATHQPWTSPPWVSKLGPAILQEGKNIAGSTLDALMGPGDAWQGNLTQEQMEQRAFGLAGLATGQGLGRAALRGATVDPTEMGIFAGQSAKTANMQAFSDALQLDKMGHTPQTILEKTGWFQGPTGEWRFEIPDNTAKMINTAPAEGSAGIVTTPGRGVSYLNAKTPQFLGDILEHPELYAAYPDLRDLIISNANKNVGTTKGQFIGTLQGSRAGVGPQTGSIWLKDPEDISSLLHEIQHGIQHGEEGLPWEAPPKDVPSKFDEPMQQVQQQMDNFRSRLENAEAVRKSNPELWTEMQKNPDTALTGADFQQHERNLDLMATYKFYKKKLAWTNYAVQPIETEARNVQTRQTMSDAARATIPPWSTQDVRPDVMAGNASEERLLLGAQRNKNFTDNGGDNFTVEDLLGPGGRFKLGSGSINSQVTANSNRDEKVKSAAQQPDSPQVAQVLQQPEVQKAIGQPKAIVRTFDVPYGAGSDKQEGITYIDKNIPQQLTVGDKTFDPAKYLNVHEQTEHALMEQLKYPYEKAHLIATAHERAAVEADGIDWKGYEEAINKMLEKTESEKKVKLPPGLYTKPYSHQDLKKFGKEQKK